MVPRNVKDFLVNDHELLINLVITFSIVFLILIIFIVIFYHLNNQSYYHKYQLWCAKKQLGFTSPQIWLIKYIDLIVKQVKLYI